MVKDREHVLRAWVSDVLFKRAAIGFLTGFAARATRVRLCVSQKPGCCESYRFMFHFSCFLRAPHEIPRGLSNQAGLMTKERGPGLGARGLAAGAGGPEARGPRPGARGMELPKKTPPR